MIEKVRELSPALLWNYFADITQIPHPSGHLEEIIAYIIKFAETNQLAVKRDEIGNILIEKGASAGYEDRKKVCLQAHLDMVPQKNSTVDHDFTKDPLKLVVDGEWLTADNTTLGADNGIGLAAALAVLADKNLKHGPVEALFTIDEETGMYGAFGLQPDFLTSDILINTDSEDEGELFVGCAGGEDVAATLQYQEDTTQIVGDMAFKLSLTGLKGGHSGCDIHLGRGNAAILMARFLKHAYANFGVRISWFEGGTLRNAIPREAFALITIAEEDGEDFLDYVNDFQQLFREEYKQTDPNITLAAEEVEIPLNYIPEDIQIDMIRTILACKNGVEGMSAEMEGIVDTSSNLGVVKAKGGEIYIHVLARGLADSKKDQLCVDLVSLFELAELKAERSGAYPGWNPNLDSDILKLMKKEHETLFGVAPKINVIHAGLECGLIGGVYPEMEMISFGPTLRFPHSPDEKVHISSVARFWDFLLATLENIPVK